MDAFYHAASQLPGAVSQALMRIPPRWAGDITEIRLRSGRCRLARRAAHGLFP
jgi:stage III sporulation protein AA